MRTLFAFPDPVNEVSARLVAATLSLTAAVLHFSLGLTTPALVAVGAILAAAALGAGLGLCLGCRLFAALMRLGVIPERVCAACADLPLRPAA